MHCYAAIVIRATSWGQALDKTSYWSDAAFTLPPRPSAPPPAAWSRGLARPAKRTHATAPPPPPTPFLPGLAWIALSCR